MAWRAAGNVKTEFLSVSQAMKEAGVFSQQIYLAISCGKLDATRDNGRWRISRTSFNAWRKRLQARRELIATEQQIAQATA